MNTEGIVIQKTEMGKLIGAGKRVWTGAKTERVAVDKIERAEGALFANDLELARMAKQKQLLDSEITTHIDKVLEESRGYNQSELNEKKEGALLDLLKDALHEFDTLSGMLAHDGKQEEAIRLSFKDLRTRLWNMIKDMEGAE